jgi:O-antigen/teichoic acid export membrane protein
MAMGALAARIVLREIDIHQLQWAPHRWKELLRACLPFGISSLSFSLRQRFDTVLMSVTLDDAIVGLYNVPLQLIGMLMLLAQSISTSMFPSLTRAFKEGWSEVHNLVHRAFKYLLMLSLPIAVGTTLLAERIVILLYTEEFRGSILLLQILIWTLPFLFVSELMGSLIMALQKEREGARVNVINASISMLFTAVLLPIFGATGASAGRVSVLGIRLGQYWRLLGSRLLVGGTGLVLLRVFLANAAMGMCVYFAQGLPLFVVIGIGVLSYPIFLFAFRAVTISEISTAVNLIFRREQHELTEPIH